MSYQIKRILVIGIASLLLLAACAKVIPTPEAGQFQDQIATMVATTLTAMPDAATATSQPAPTDTPPLPPTEAAPPTQTALPPTLTLPSLTPTLISEYACDIIDQRPFDDTKLRPNENFVIKWTIVNIGTKRWQKGTVLHYQDGPRMTKETSIDMPTLKPGEQYQVILNATAPAEKERQIMVWVIEGPGEVKNSHYWMCYPYVRIIVSK